MSEPRKKILILTLGTRGDVQPFVALAKQLTARGHEVVLSTGQGFDDMIAAVGATSKPVSVDYAALLARTDVKAALHGGIRMIRMVRWGLRLQRQIAEELWQIGMEEKPDLIVFNPKGVAGTLIGRALDIPAIPAMMQPLFSETGAFPPQFINLPDLGYGLNRLLQRAFLTLIEKGARPALTPVLKRLPPELRKGRVMAGHMPSGVPAPRLQAYSAALAEIPEDWPATDHVTGYWFTDPAPDYTPPDDLAAFLESGPPPVYIGFGSMPSREPAELAETILEAIRKTGIRAVLALGWGGLETGTLPQDLAGRVHVLRSAPHSWLFPRCAAVVHHGGAGTTHEGLRWGRPTLVCPVFGDQPYWARQVARVGAGPAPIPAKKLTTERLAAALVELQQPSYRQAAARIAQEIAAEGGTENAANRLEAVLAG